MRTNDIFTTTYSPGSDPLRSRGRMLEMNVLKGPGDLKMIVMQQCLIDVRQPITV